MSQIRWYIDEDSSDTGLVRSLQNQAIDVVTVLSANRRGYSDEAQLIWGTEQVILNYLQALSLSKIAGTNLMQ